MSHSSKSHSRFHHADFGTDHTDSKHTQRSQRAAHQDFRWVDSARQGNPYANFLETTLDITTGIHACLQIAYAADLERAANCDADEGEMVTPAIGIVESDQLVRLAIAAAGLLREETRRQVDALNS